MNKNFRKKYFVVNQSDFKMYLTKLTVTELLNNTDVEFYNHLDESGYQRQLIPEHYRRIARFLKDSESPVMPSSIICAIDSKYVDIYEDEIVFKNILRLVDGQHRREGFKYLFNHYSKDITSDYINYELPLIVLIIEDDDDKLIEIETFVNINSKGKAVKTDLAVELREKLRTKRNCNFELKTDFTESIATNVAKICNETYRSPWYDKIKMAEEKVQKPIGINTFKLALTPVINAYLDFKEVEYAQINRGSSEFNQIVNEIVELVNEAWNVVYKKWPEAFENYKEYNITKSIGINSISIILAECINSFGDNSAYEFSNVIKRSRESVGLWRRGGELSGYSSEQGFKLVADRIKTI